MKKRIMIALCLIVAGGLVVQAEMPQQMYYAGYCESNGAPYVGSLDLQLQIYTAASNGQCLYEDSATLELTNGYYTTIIGDDMEFGSLPDSLKSGEAYLQVVENGATQAVRVQLLPGAYALMADGVRSNGITANMIAAGAVETAHLDSGAVTGGKIAEGTITTYNLDTDDIDNHYLRVDGGTMQGQLINAAGFVGNGGGLTNVVAANVVVVVRTNGTVSNYGGDVVSAVQSAGRGDVVRIGPGSYNIGFLYAQSAGVSIVGAGKPGIRRSGSIGALYGGTILYGSLSPQVDCIVRDLGVASTNANQLINLNAADETVAVNATLQRVSLSSVTPNGTNYGVGFGLMASGTGFIIDDVSVYGCYHALWLAGRDIFVRNIEGLDCPRTLTIAAYTTNGTKNLQLSNIASKRCVTNATAGCIVIVAANNGSVENINICNVLSGPNVQQVVQTYSSSSGCYVKRLQVVNALGDGYKASGAFPISDTLDSSFINCRAQNSVGWAFGGSHDSNISFISCSYVGGMPESWSTNVTFGTKAINGSWYLPSALLFSNGAHAVQSSGDTITGTLHIENDMAVDGTVQFPDDAWVSGSGLQGGEETPGLLEWGTQSFRMGNSEADDRIELNPEGLFMSSAGDGNLYWSNQARASIKTQTLNGDWTIQSNLTISGTAYITAIPRQGDISMGSFTNEP